jgi:hypothetical protein
MGPPLPRLWFRVRLSTALRGERKNHHKAMSKVSVGPEQTFGARFAASVMLRHGSR